MHAEIQWSKARASPNHCSLDVTDGPGILSQSLYLCLAAESASLTGLLMGRCPGYVRDPLKIGSSVSISFHIRSLCIFIRGGGTEPFILASLHSMYRGATNSYNYTQLSVRSGISPDMSVSI